MSFWTGLYRWAVSLRVRLVMLLSLALLPLGAIAVIQTVTVIGDAEELEERDLIARTLNAVRTEHAVLRRAYGAADGLGVMALTLGAEDPACSRAMSTFVDTEAAFVFAGFISLDGVMRCSSVSDEIDFSDYATWKAFIENPGPAVTVNNNGAASGQSVVVASVDVRDATGALIGALSVSVPHDLTDELLGASEDVPYLALVDQYGRILSASTGVETADRFERLGLVPNEIPDIVRGQSVRYEQPDGSRAMAAIVPVIDDRIYVVGLWESDQMSYGPTVLGWVVPAFPILMYLATLVIAILAVERLILRHLVRLGKTMRNFSPDRPALSRVDLRGAPTEIRQMAAQYNALINAIIADRAMLETSIAEKDLLLREVHHRVKNNLQLIASIMNMQIRTVADGTAKSVLRRVQDRVISLSSLHKAIYAGSSLKTVRADHLLEELVRHSLSTGLTHRAGVKTDVSLAQLDIDPDQAVPLALLANELVTNAVKNVGRPPADPAHIGVSLMTEGLNVTLSVENTLGPKVLDELGQDGTGLGARLIDAFVGQLGATSQITSDDGHYRCTVSFTALEVPETEDACDGGNMPVAKAS
ncbi:MAG: sensor histidine kinase [Pseudomonadota bacterium]